MKCTLASFLFAELKECASNPCVHGECKQLHNKYECCCLMGYTGQHCDSGKIIEINRFYVQRLRSTIGSVGTSPVRKLKV